MIKNALDKGIDKFIIGIGGSATNDAGIGMLDALGMKFYDKNNNALSPIGKSLNYITRIDESNFDNRIKESNFLVASDVNNPLFGINGAAYIYGPQKGADEKVVKELDQGLQNFTQVVKKQLNIDPATLQSARAARGLGYAFATFLNAELRPSIEIIFSALDLESAIKETDLIITGEGKIDKQSKMGKIISGVVAIAKKYYKPVIALAGIVEENLNLESIGITATFSIIDKPLLVKEAMRSHMASSLIKQKTIELMKFWKVS